MTSVDPGDRFPTAHREWQERHNPPTDDVIVRMEPKERIYMEARVIGREPDPAPPTDGPAREPSELYRPAPPTGDRERDPFIEAMERAKERATGLYSDTTKSLAADAGDRGERPEDVLREALGELLTYSNYRNETPATFAPLAALDALVAERDRLGSIVAAAEDIGLAAPWYTAKLEQDLAAERVRGDRAEDALRAIRTMISTTEDPTAANLTVWGICDHALAADPEAPSYYLPSPGRLELGAVRVETIALMVVAGAVVYFLLHALVRVVGDSFQTYQQAVG